MGWRIDRTFARTDSFKMIYSLKASQSGKRYHRISYSPPECYEVSIKGDVLDHPVGEGDLADVYELSTAYGVLDFHDFESPIEKSVKRR